MIDMMLFTNAGTSLGKFIEEQTGVNTKQAFPYEYMDNYKCLSETKLPLIKAFNSKLKHSEYVESDYTDDYAAAQKLWKEANCTTMLDYLLAYNDTDVVPFLDAINKFRHTILELVPYDAITNAVSIASIASTTAFYMAYEDQFKIINEDLNKRRNKYSRQAIIDMYTPAWLTKKEAGYIRQDQEHFERDPSNPLPRPMTSIEILDRIVKIGNLCYHCGNEMSPETCTLDRIVNSGYHTANNTVACCLTCNVKRANNYNLLEFREMMIMQTYHDHFVFTISNEVIFNIIRQFVGGPSLVFGRYHKAGETFIKRPIYDPTKKDNKDHGWSMSEPQEKVGCIAGYDENSLYPYAASQPCMCGKPIYIPLKDKPVEAAMKIVQDKFGFIVCDLHVPEELYNKFAVFQPIFKNTNMPMGIEDIGSYMTKIIHKLNYKSAESRKLIGSFHAEQITLHSDLYKWYVNHGLIIDKIHVCIQYQPCDLFSKFVNLVADFRRRADLDKTDPRYLPKSTADTWKLIANSFVGTTIMNKHKQHEIVVSDSEKVYTRNAMSSRMNDIEMVPCEGHKMIYEMWMKKRKVDEDKPTQIGAAVYGLAKLRVLEFMFDFIYKHIPTSKFSEMHMDTDSMYLAIAGETPIMIKDTKDKNPHYIFKDEPDKHITEEMIGVELLRRLCTDKAAFDIDAPKFMVFTKYDARTPGIVKVEKLGLCATDLAPKTNYMIPIQAYETNDDHTEIWKGKKAPKNKLTSKGVSKRNERDLSMSNFTAAITEGKSTEVTNVGFRYDPRTHTEITYEAKKIGISPMYIKKRVCDNGIDCLPTLV